MENEPVPYNWDLLEQAVEMQFDGWRPEEGDMILGTVVYLSEGESQWGPYPMVAVISREGEPIMIHAFHTIMRNALERQRPQPGDHIGVKYVGRQPSKQGNDSYVYNVVVQHAFGGDIAIEAGEEQPALPAVPMEDDQLSMREAQGEPPGWENPAAEGPPAPAATVAGRGPAGSAGEKAATEASLPAGPPATTAQRAAINKLLAAKGEEPLDWETAMPSMQEASALIKSLQRS